ncbi:MAG: DUF2073 domain-containing protein [Candidatus Pacearchaeota archaeon]
MVNKKRGVKKIKKNLRKLPKGLTIHFMPHSEIVNKDSIERIKLLMKHILENKIVILQGKLKPDQETRLIENSMTLIGNIKGFQGIEVATISGESTGENLFEKIRYNLAKILVGEKDSITIIGPASIVKEMKRDPSQIELLLQN